MRCPKCDTEILDNSKVCPNCKTYLFKDDDLNIELPMMKKDPQEENIEDLPDTKKYVLDYEKEQPKKEIEIEASNENIDAIKDSEGVSSPTVNDILEYEPDLPETKEEQIEKMEELEEKETRKIKKKYLFVCGIIGIIILALLLLVLGTIRNNNINKYDLKGEISKALNTYYNSNGENYSELNKVLEHTYKEQNKLDSVREETYHSLDEWLNEYLNTEAKNAEEFSTSTVKYRKIITNIYNKVEVDNIKLVEEEKYKEYLNKFDRISLDSKIFYKALDFYDKNDYNEAYKIFNNIDETNSYYKKALEYKTKIINTVISSIKKDITPLELDIEEKTSEEKVNTYNQIIEIITKYSETYSELHLTENESYNEYLNNYRNKIGEIVTP